MSKTFWRLRQHSNIVFAEKLREVLPELKKSSLTDISKHLYNSDLELYASEKCKTRLIVRLTLPLAFIAIVLFFLFIPINYMVTGHWGYRIKFISNWFRELGF
jgi:hypothetical protein